MENSILSYRMKVNYRIPTQPLTEQIIKTFSRSSALAVAPDKYSGVIGKDTPDAGKEATWDLELLVKDPDTGNLTKTEGEENETLRMIIADHALEKLKEITSSDGFSSLIKSVGVTPDGQTTIDYEMDGSFVDLVEDYALLYGDNLEDARDAVCDAKRDRCLYSFKTLSEYAYTYLITICKMYAILLAEVNRNLNDYVDSYHIKKLLRTIEGAVKAVNTLMRVHGSLIGDNRFQDMISESPSIYDVTDIPSMLLYITNNEESITVASPYDYLAVLKHVYADSQCFADYLDHEAKCIAEARDNAGKGMLSEDRSENSKVLYDIDDHEIDEAVKEAAFSVTCVQFCVAEFTANFTFAGLKG